MSDTCKGKVCPSLSTPQKMIECIEHRCAHYQHLLGKNPQSGKPIDHWDCAFNWANILAVENAQQSRQTAAAVESFRNEFVKGQYSANQKIDRLIGVVEVAGRGGRPEAIDVTPSIPEIGK